MSQPPLGRSTPLVPPLYQSSVYTLPDLDALDRIMNAEGLRYPQEFVRHKALDAVGDLALAGAPLLGAYRSVRGGHKLNHAVLTALLADRSAWRVVEGEAARRIRVPAEAGSGMVAGMIAPAYGPDVS